MEWRHFTRAQYITTAWSGGTTTQLAIAPEGAVYADRKFLWRLSSAQVELEHSDFTPLPDYDRLISVLKGELELKIGQGERGALCGFQFDAAEGRMSGLCAADCVTRRWQLPVGGSGARASEISKPHACAVLRGGGSDSLRCGSPGGCRGTSAL